MPAPETTKRSMPRRDTELALLAAAAPVVLLVFALVKGAVRSDLTASDLLVPCGLLLAFALAHLAARRFAPGADPALLPIAALLSGLGLAVITRLDAATAGQALAPAQLMWLFAGIAALVATLAIVPSLERLARFKYSIMLSGLVLLLLPAVVGREINGAKLWLRFGGVSFQPAEVAKILVVLFLAAYLAENREVLSVSTRRVMRMWLPPARQLGPLVAMWAVSLVIMIGEKDLGSSLLFFGIFLAMVYVATGRSAYVAAGALLFAGGAAAAYFTFAHVRSRIGIWIDPFADPQGAGYQLVQSLFSLAAGGLTGTGMGRGLPDRIPFVATDFIFSAIGEELGLLGAAGVALAYLVFCLRGLGTAVRARSDMAALTAAGLVASFGLQAFVIIGGVSRLIPLTGITLPFVSYGGSSILSNFILLGLLMRAGAEAPAEGVEPVSLGHAGVLGRAPLARRLTHTAWLVSALIAALVANLTYVQVIAAPALAADPRNTRNLEKELRGERGAILTRDGVVLARSVPSGGRFERTYPAGTLAALAVGYYSPRYGRAGIEAAMNETLAGHREFATFADAMDEALGRPIAGSDVVLTIDSRVQRAAEAALAGRRGACVAIDPRTGDVLALASSPGYEPGRVDALWPELSKGGDAAPLVDRAIASLYPPGSTFKVVTLTGALAQGVATPDTVYPAPAVLEVGGGKVTNFEGEGGGSATLRQATASSINTVYAQVAVELGAKRLVDQARAYGLDRAIPFDLTVRPSLMPAPELMTKWETAWAGVGQPVGASAVKGPVVTPLQMALVASGVANAGSVMRPRLVARTQDSSGRTIAAAAPSRFSVACDEATARVVRDLMVEAVRSGSGSRAAIKGVSVAGKTGTAEVGKSTGTHSWFIAFAPADKPVVAFAIVLEEAGVGGRIAAPAAKPVLEAALRAQLP
jgi:cell division protein FtsW (lipid II flippase)/cell division protein FtsI/penicillin-binding protein 2